MLRENNFQEMDCCFIRSYLGHSGLNVWLGDCGMSKAGMGLKVLNQWINQRSNQFSTKMAITKAQWVQLSVKLTFNTNLLTWFHFQKSCNESSVSQSWNTSNWWLVYKLKKWEPAAPSAVEIICWLGEIQAWPSLLKTPNWVLFTTALWSIDDRLWGLTHTACGSMRRWSWRENSHFLVVMYKWLCRLMQASSADNPLSYYP